MTRYDIQAIDFCIKYGIKIKFKFAGAKVNKFWNETEKRNVWKCIIKKDNRQYTVTFWDSIHNTINGIKPTEYDLLASLTKYDPESYEDFCNNYGYEQNKNNYKLYLAVQREYDNLCRVFDNNEELWEDFREIC